MALSTALNTVAHGHVHELMGGTWSGEFRDFSKRVTTNVLPFLHTIQVSDEKPSIDKRREKK